jgi:hypothetical protein
MTLLKLLGLVLKMQMLKTDLSLVDCCGEISNASSLFPKMHSLKIFEVQCFHCKSTQDFSSTVF